MNITTDLLIAIQVHCFKLRLNIMLYNIELNKSVYSVGTICTNLGTHQLFSEEYSASDSNFWGFCCAPVTVYSLIRALKCKKQHFSTMYICPSIVFSQCAWPLLLSTQAVLPACNQSLLKQKPERF